MGEEEEEKELTVAVETGIVRNQFTRQRSRCTAQFKSVIETDVVVEMKPELSPLSDIHVDEYADVLSPVDDEDMIAQLEMFGNERNSNETIKDKTDQTVETETNSNGKEDDMENNEKSESYSAMIKHCNQRRFIEQEIIATEESYYNGLD